MGLREAQAQLRRLLPDGGYLLRLAPDAQFEFVSDEVAELVGFTPGDHYRDPHLWERIVDPDDRAQLAQVSEQPLDQPTTALMRFHGGDGAVRAVWHRAVRRQLDDGAVVLAGTAWAASESQAPVPQAANRDHTAPQPVEQDRLAAAVWSMLDPHLLLRAVRDEADQLTDLVVVDANEAACSAFGLSRDELLGAFLGELQAPAGRWSLFSGCMDTMRTGRSLVADDAPYRQPNDGRELRLDVRAVRFGADRVSVTWRDVTARYQAAQHLEGQRSLLRATLDSELDPHIVMSAVRDEAGRIVDFRYLAANPVALAQMGMTEQELLGMRLREVYPSDAARVLLSMYAYTVASSEPLVADDFAYPRGLFGGEERRYDLRGARMGDGLSLTWRDVTDRHHDRVALAESEARFRNAMASATIGMCLVHPDGSFLQVNPALCDLLGRDAATLLATSWQELTHPADLDADLLLLRQVLDGRRESYRLRKRYLRADGAVVHGDLAVGCVRDSLGAVRYLVSQIIDVSRQVRAEQELAASRDEYRLLAEHASDVVFRGDNAGVIRWLSDSVVRVLGRQPGEMIGRPFLDFVHPEDADRVRAAQVQLSSGTAASFEVRLATSNGDWRWLAISAHPVLDPDGSVVGRAGGWRDITAEVAARHGMEQSLTRLGQALEAQADPQAIHEAVRDDAGRVVDLRCVAANTAMCRHLGRPRDQVVGRLLTQVQPQTDPEQLSQYAQVIETGTPLEWNEVEIDSYTTGERRIVDFRCYKVGDGVSMTLRDITERVVAQRALAAAEARYRSIARSAAVGLVVIAPGGELIEVNDAACQLTGRDPGALLAATWADLAHPDERDEDLRRLDDLLAGRGETSRRRTRLVRGDDDVVWVDLSIAAVRAPGAGVDCLIAQMVDITKAVAAGAELAAPEQRYRMIAENAADVILQVGADGLIWWASPSATESLQWPVHGLVGRSLREIVDPDWADRIQTWSHELGECDRADLTVQARRGDGSLRWVQLQARTVPAEGNRPSFQVVRVRDAHAEVLARTELAAERALLSDTLDAMIDPHLIVQPVRHGTAVLDMVCLQANPAAADFLGVKRADLLGKGLGQALGDSADQLVRWCAQVADTGEPLMLQAQPYPEAGASHYITVRVTRVGQAVAINLSDVTEAQRAAAQLAQSEAQYRLLADHSGDVVVSTDPSGLLTYVSPAVTAVLGWQPQDLVGTYSRDLVHPDDVHGVAAALQQVRTGTGRIVIRARLRRVDGTYAWISSVGRFVTHDTGAEVGVVATWRDIGTQVAAEQQTESERSRLAAVLDSELEPHVYLEALRNSAGEIADFAYRDVNDAACDYLDRPRDQLEGARLSEPLSGPTGPEMLAVYAGAVSSGDPLVLDDFAVPRAGPVGSRFDVRAVRVGDGLSLAWRDVTGRFRDAQDLAESRQQYRLLAENATDAVFSADAQGVLTFVTPGVTRILGFTPEQVVGRSLVDLVHPDDRMQLAQDLHLQGGSWPRRVRMMHASGAQTWVEVNATGVREDTGAVVAIVGGWHDVSAEEVALESLRRQARTDGLTGLSNRGEIIRQLDSILAHPPRRGQQVAALFCDLDGLKNANDSQGHAAGNLLITAAAQRIRSAVRTSDLVARFGGDEFLVVLTGLRGQEEALAVAEKIRLSMTEPISNDSGPALAATFSIGVAMVALGDDVDSLIARADAAMYTAKRAGGDAVTAGSS